MNCIDLAPLLLTDQHLSHSVSDYHPTERERKRLGEEAGKAFAQPQNLADM